MKAHPRLTAAAIVFAGAAMTGLVFAQGAGTPPQAPPQTPPAQPPPAGQTPTPPAAGRGAGVGPGAAAGAEQGGRAGGGQRRGGFTQYTRPLASADVLARGKALYDTNCASCHAIDLRGTVDGKNPNLLRSGVALRDQQGELVTAAVASHRPALTMTQADTVAIAEYIHSVHATMGGQGSPPGRNPTNVTLNVLVGDAKAGEATFATRCGACHSVTGDLAKIGSKFADARALQNGWVSGSSTTFGGRGGGGGGAGLPATITLANGSKLDGSLVRQDDFLVILRLADGTRRSFARTNGVPSVEVKDPRAGHVNAIVKLGHEDTTSKMMHDITAYLWTIK
jgi:cytochrome c oxidase cbb3-type subunit 3